MTDHPWEVAYEYNSNQQNIIAQAKNEEMCLFSIFRIMEQIIAHQKIILIFP